ncbi:MAG: outer membrane beta-barrel protein [Thermodesulfobacteriota bacterium]
MKIRIIGAMLIGLFLLAFVTSESKAKSQQEQIDELKTMIEQNQMENQELRKKLEQIESERAVEKTNLEEMMTKKEEKDEKGEVLLGFLKSIKLSFYVDTSYEYNFNDPESGTNQLRVFDTQANSFNINLFQLAFKKTPTTEGGLIDLIGFGVKLDFGEDAQVLSSVENLGDQDDEFDLQEAYIHALAPVGNGVDIYAGKFVTLAGAEVIESKDDFNFSRSFLFGFAIPFSHTGVRLHYPAGPLDFIAGVNNGWDVVKDNNDGKTIESRIGLTLGDIFSLGVVGYFGPEEDTGKSQWRELIDVVATITPIEKLILVANLDFGWQQNVTDADLGLDDEGVFWWGIAGYIVYDFNDVFRLALRSEYFDDKDGFRTGTEQQLFEITPTLSIKPFCNKGKLDNLVLRFEYRFDHSNEDVFENDNSEFEDTQQTVATELLYYFSL